jgi:hypothetical protein
MVQCAFSRGTAVDRYKKRAGFKPALDSSVHKYQTKLFTALLSHNRRRDDRPPRAFFAIGADPSEPLVGRLCSRHLTPDLSKCTSGMSDLMLEMPQSKPDLI